jgi:hypothetical protein
MKRLYFFPRDFLVNNTTARARGAFGAWTVIGSAIGALFFGSEVLYVTVLSIVALIPNVTSETPVEHE